MNMASKTWQEIAQEAQDHRDRSLAEVQPPLPEIKAEDLPLNVTSIPALYLSPSEIEISETSPEKLVELLATGELSCVEVTNAFLRRAGLAQKLVTSIPFPLAVSPLPSPSIQKHTHHHPLNQTNCVTELLPHRALSRAEYLDDYLATHHQPIGPLHGLPISVKEHIGMKGLPQNAAFIAWYHDPAPASEPHILQLLWRAGCVFYVRTTQPQILMHLETSSNLHGVTVNPHNRQLTSGGSSGGEGALLGLRASPLGLGSDIGGSIRSPAANNGLYGLRTTSTRLPLAGVRAPMLGAEHILPVLGPLSTSLAGCALFMKAILDQKPWLTDPSLTPLPWRSPSPNTTPTRPQRFTRTNPLRIGIMPSDAIVRPHPPITRALADLTAKLRHIPEIALATWAPYKHDEAWQIIASLYFADGGREDMAALAAGAEPWRLLTKFILSENQYVQELSVARVWGLTGRREGYRAE